jgi:hypothetical protein
MTTKVINIDTKQPYDVYIGRGSRFGSPYSIGIDGDREEVIRKYRYDFERGYLKASKEEVLALKGKVLGCHCKPFACHGDVLVEFINK